jgi:hypothetical protein
MSSEFAYPSTALAGIEPSMHGGFTLFRPDGRITVHDAPVRRLRSGRCKYVLQKMAALLDEVPIGLAIVEAPDSTSEYASTNQLGHGLWVGMLFAKGIRCLVVPPERWKASILHRSRQEHTDAVEFINQFSHRIRRHTPRWHSEGCVVATCLSIWARRITFAEENE